MHFYWYTMYKMFPFYLTFIGNAFVNITTA